jgi:hypothetical protein
VIRAPVVALALGTVLFFVLSGCAKKDEGPPVGVSTKSGTSSAPSDKPVVYSFDPLDEHPVSSEANIGKPTVIAIITTGDIVGQAQVSFLVAMAKNDGEKVNYAMVALHPRREIVLVEAYRRTLNVEFPAALGDSSLTGPSGPFGEIAAVPTVIILDRVGRMVWKHTGLANSDELRAHMRGL